MFKINRHKSFLFSGRGLRIFLFFVFSVCIISIQAPSQTSAEQVIRPIAGEKLESGKPYEIKYANIRGASVNINWSGGGISGKIATAVNNTGTFSWNVDCTLKGKSFVIWVASATSDSRVRSNPFEIIDPKQVVAPSPGENVRGGSRFVIKWTGFNCGYVQIDLTQKSKSGVSHLTVSTRNTGAYYWQVPGNLQGSDFQLWVRDTSRLSCSAVSDCFSINPAKPGLPVFKAQKEVTPNVTMSAGSKRVKLLLKPKGGETLKAGSAYEIKWTGLLGGPNVRIILIENNQFSANLALNAENNGSFIWNIGPVEHGANYQIKVTGYRNNTGDFVISRPFAIVLPAKVTKPSSYFTLHPGKKFFINWQNFTSPTLIIELWQGGALKETLTRSAPNSKTYEWLVASHYIGYGFKIKIKSTVNPDEFAFSEDFKILN